jgi:hypothetical protein
MDIYQIGPLPLDDFSDYEYDQFEWVVYWYNVDGCEGYGEAIALCNEDGFLYIKGLGHCSCYGPMDDGFESCDKITIEDFLNDQPNVLGYVDNEEVKNKVLELIKCLN